MKIDKKTINEIRKLYEEKKEEIKKRLNEFEEIYKNGDNKKFFRELCFCILSSGVGPKVAQRSIDKIDENLLTANETSLFNSIKEVHKYPDKSFYIFSTREYLVEEFNFELKTKLDSFDDKQDRRDFIANNKNIKGLGYVQASHFLRNVGYKGYAILDKNILKTIYEFGITDDIKPATSKSNYIEKEEKLEEFAKLLNIGFDEIDLLLWCRKTGYIPR